MGKKRNNKLEKIIKKLFILIALAFALFAVGYSVGIVPESWVISAEMFLNGGKPIEDIGPGNTVTLFQNIINDEKNAEEQLFGSDESGSGDSSTDLYKRLFPKRSGSADSDSSYESPSPSLPTTIETPKSVASGNYLLTVECLDVGQADCTLIYTGSHAMLIDGGNIADGLLVAGYIRSLGIEHLDYVIATHAHEDHIGGLDDVIEQLDVGCVMLPNTTEQPNGTFTYLCNAVTRSGIPTSSPAVGVSYDLGEAVWTILSCDAADDDTNENEYSIVIKLAFGDTSFLFMGDAETPNESAILRAGYDVNVDVLRVGHHGSNTSTGDALLDAASPDAAIISVGTDNAYGHPKKNTLSKLEGAGCEVYRTDLNGTVTIVSDGIGLSFDSKTTNTDGK